MGEGDEVDVFVGDIGFVDSIADEVGEMEGVVVGCLSGVDAAVGWRVGLNAVSEDVAGTVDILDDAGADGVGGPFDSEADHWVLGIGWGVKRVWEPSSRGLCG